MRHNLITDFSVDKKNNTIKIKREFFAPKKHVWAAWTDPELLDQCAEAISHRNQIYGI